MTLLLQQKLPRRRGITNLPPSLGTHLSAETRYGNRRLTPTFCRAATGGARQQKQEPALNCSSPMAGDWSELPRAHRTSQTPLIVSWWVGTGRSTHHAAWTASQCFLVRHKVLTEVAPNWSAKRTPTRSMASPFLWALLVPSTRCAPSGAAYLGLQGLPHLCKQYLSLG